MNQTSIPRSARPKFPTTPLRLLHISMEVAPWAVVGDVAEYVRGLAAAQADAGDKVTVVVPRHGDGRWPITRQQQVVGSKARLLLGDREIPFQLRRLRHPDGFEVVLVQCELFERAGIYANPDTLELHPDGLLRSSVLCHAALYYALNAGGRWQVIHGHDHHGALATALLRRRFQPTPLQHARSVLTVHDPFKLGLHPPEETLLAGLPWSEGQPDGPFAYQGGFSCLRAGMELAHRVHAVAPAHAELLSDRGPEGHPFAFEPGDPRLGTVPGGVDPERWDPATDPALASSFDARDLSGRGGCRDELLSLAGWDDGDALLVGYVGPLVPERGLELLAEAIEARPDDRVRVLVVGDGDADLVDAWRELADRDDRVWFERSDDDALRRQVLAGLDAYCLPGAEAVGELGFRAALRYGALLLAAPGVATDDVPELARLPFEDDLGAALDQALEIAAAEPLDARRVSAMQASRPWHAVARQIRTTFYLEPVP